MAIKRGRIERVGRIGRKFVQADLDSGERVEIPIPLMDELTARFSITEDDLVFVEAKGRVFNYVQWAGTEQEYAELVTAAGTSEAGSRSAQSGAGASSAGIGPRIIWYLIFSAAIVAAITILQLPQWVLYGYLVIAVIGLAMAIRDNL